MTPLLRCHGSKKGDFMGFGHIFIGYFFLIFFPLSRVELLPNLSIVGCFFMFMGLRRLIHYCNDKPQFKKAESALIGLAVLSAVTLVFDAVKMCGAVSDSVKSYASPFINVAYAAIVCTFVLFLLNGICKLAKEVGLPKLSKRAVWMMSVTVLYVVLEVSACACSLILGFSGSTSDVFAAITAYMGLFAFLLAYLCIFLNLSLLFSCYARICLEGDEDMPYREDIFDKIVASVNRKKK